MIEIARTNVMDDCYEWVTANDPERGVATFGLPINRQRFRDLKDLKQAVDNIDKPGFALPARVSTWIKAYRGTKRRLNLDEDISFIRRNFAGPWSEMSSVAKAELLTALTKHIERETPALDRQVAHAQQNLRRVNAANALPHWG